MSNVEEQGVDGGRGKGVNARAGVLGQEGRWGQLNPRGEGKQTPPLALGAREGVALGMRENRTPTRSRLR